MESNDLCMLSHTYTAIYTLTFPLVSQTLIPASSSVALLGLWILSVISGGK